VLRGVAACSVVILHGRYFSGAPMGDSVARLGAAGVDLFFVISGFIMATIAKPSAGRFLIDRFWRIVPFWFVALAPWLAWKQPTGSVLLASLTLWPVYHQFTAPALSLGWTLSFELLFYLSLAAALLTRPLVPLTSFALALVAGVLTHAPVFDFIGNPMIFEFLFGVAIARLPRETRFALPLLAAGVIGLAVAPQQLFHAEIAVDAARSGWRVLFWGFPSALVVYGCLSAERAFARRELSPLVLLGDASYSIYLFHLAFIRILNLPWPVEFFLAVAGGIAVWRFVERPLLRLKHIMRRSQRPQEQRLNSVEGGETATTGPRI